VPICGYQPAVISCALSRRNALMLIPTYRRRPRRRAVNPASAVLDEITAAGTAGNGVLVWSTTPMSSRLERHTR
jgi:hypothetical protein